MEITKHIVKLSFESSAQWAAPAASIRIHARRGDHFTTGIEISIPLISLVRENADPGEVAEAALQRCEQLLDAAGLSALLEEMLEHQEQMDAQRYPDLPEETSGR